MLKRMSRDNSLLATHMSLFTALFICWQRNAFVSPFMVNRRMLMTYAKIASVATYHKCIRELREKEYIGYKPSYHPQLGSQIWWLEQFDDSDASPPYITNE
ncbi:hypothetical protein [Pedobacter sp. V48]|uniref:hypothetical protein n=1 Tax=Pedobacter sp. V48 TaxID=509635 RepID=UPI001F1B97D6|nr:hypothetical protein [Pedobacter sp. V48]